MRKEIYEDIKDYLKRHNFNLTGYKFNGKFVWINDKAKIYTFKEPERILKIENIDYKARYSGDTLVIDALVQGQLKCNTLVANRLDEEILKNLSDEHLDKLLKQLYDERLNRKLTLRRAR